MSAERPPKPGDQARVSVTVAIDRASAFAIFTEEIDRWWRRGLRYRVAGKRRGIIAIEPRVGGRLYESFDEDDAGDKPRHVVETGRVTVWSPPERLVFEWRSVAFEPSEKTEVEVTFEPVESGTLVTIVHRGWAAIRPDHPAKHGLAVEAFIRVTGMWWGELATSYRELIDAGG